MIELPTIEFARDLDQGSIGFQFADDGADEKKHIGLVICEISSKCKVGTNGHDVEKAPILALKFYHAESIDTLIRVLETTKKELLGGDAP